jgi:F-type H+-transporting ATPase subunit epsilon
MAEKFKVNITTPGKLVFEDNVEMVTIPGEEGEFGVLAGHSPLISGIASGLISIYSDNSLKDRVFVAGGFAEVNQKEVNILATESYNLSKIKKTDIEDKIAKAQIKLNTSDIEFDKKIAQEIIDINQKILSYL